MNFSLTKSKFLFNKALHFLLLSVLLIISVIVYTTPFKTKADVTYSFANKIGGGFGSSGQKIFRDASGNIYVVGYYQGASIDFDPGAGAALLSSVSSSVDIFVAKFDSNGNYIWAKSMGGTSADYGMSIAVDGSGFVYTVGYFAGTADFDPSASPANLVSAGSNDIFISKLDSNGNYVWAKKIGGTLGDQGLDIALDSSGNVYTTGLFAGSNVDFDPGAGTANLSSDGGNDIFVSKLNADGTYAWAKKMGGTGADVGYAIALDSSNNVYTTGTYNVSAYFPSGSGFGCSAQGGTDIFISKLDLSGNYITRICSVRGANNEFPTEISVDSSNNIYTTGYFLGTNVDFNPAAATSYLNATGEDAFIQKLNSDGTYAWAKRLGGTGVDRGNGISVNSTGVYTIGYYSDDDADFDPGAGVVNFPTHDGSNNIFILRLSDTDGSYGWVKGMGGTLIDQGRGIVSIPGEETVYTTGLFDSTVDFDPGAGTVNLTSGGALNIFIAKYGGVNPASINITPSTDISITEGVNNPTAYTVSLGSAPTDNVIITITESSNSINVENPTLTFTTSNWNTPQTVSVTGSQDSNTVNEIDQVITLDPSSADAVYNALPNQVRNVDVTDNDTPSFNITPVSDITMLEGSTNTTAYQVVLGTEPASNVVIDITESSPQITLNTNSLTFTTVNWNVIQNVSITATEDNTNSINEVNQAVTFAINDASSDNQFDSLANQNRQIDFTDNDIPSFSVTQTGGNTSVIEEGTTDSFSIVLGSQPSGNVVIDVVSSDTSAITLSVPEVSFTTVDWNIPKNVTVTGINDTDTDSENVTITVSIDQAQTADTNYDTLPYQNLSASVTDNDITDIIIYENKFPPINTSTVTQRKSGSLKIGGLTSTSYARFDGLFKIPSGAGAGLVLTSDADGDASWATLSGGSGSGGGWTLSGNTVSLINITDNLSIGSTTKIYKGGTSLSSIFLHNTGSNNLFGGLASGYNISSGNDNVGIGKNSLINLSYESYNTAIGFESGLGSNFSENTAIGNQTLYGNTGIGNVGVGHTSLTFASGAENTAAGYGALSGISGNPITGDHNTAIGQGALSTNVSGSQNTAIGYGAGPSVSNLSNSTAIGYGASVDANNKVVIGNTSVTIIGGSANWSNFSDIRLKENIQDSDLGLDLIKKLRPVSFNMKSGGDLNYGFIAQEVEEAVGKKTSIVLTDNSKEGYKSMTYGSLIAPLTKAVKEQDLQLGNDKKDLGDFEKELKALEEKLK